MEDSGSATRYKSDNIVEKRSVNNDRGFIIEQCKSEQLKTLFFFIKTIIEWNHLETAVAHAETVEGFRTLISQRDLHSLPVRYAEKPCTATNQKQMKNKSKLFIGLVPIRGLLVYTVYSVSKERISNLLW